ncbi:MAG TPA: hypothetical protein VGM31_10740 [Puia sp.]|jgi:sialate O-acetylesterase
MKRSHLFILAACCFVSKLAFGKIILPELIGDNMVLQQQTTVLLWGWADPKEKVSVYTSWNRHTATVRTDKRGIWKLWTRTTKAGGPYFIEFTASNRIKLENVLLGEVWLASGQLELDLKTVPSSNIRFIDVRHTVADTPVMGISGKWKMYSPAGTGAPIGIINAAVRGTPIESWIKMSVLRSDTAFAPILDRYEQACAEYRQKHEAYLAKMDAWHKDGKKGPSPAAPLGPKSSSSPSRLYNGMIAPLMNYRIARVIWRHGPARDPELYRKLLQALISSWRSDCKNKALAFYTP